MASNYKRMDEIRSVLQVYLKTKSFKATSKQTGISRNTIKGYVRRLGSFGLPVRSISRLSDAYLKKLLYGKNHILDSERLTFFDSKVCHWLKELTKPGVTRFLLWKEYKDERPSGYCYSQFCDRLSKYIKGKNLSISLKHKPADVVMVDFAGKRMTWYDPIIGERQYAEVLVAILPFSGYTFAVALASQKIVDFIEGLQAVFSYLGGLPKVLLSDNLRSYVKKSDRYSPQFTDLCMQLAAHYGIELSATRVAHPKDKAAVENMVATVYKRLYAPLRNKRFESIESINKAFKPLLEKHNIAAFQKKEGSRMSWFAKREKHLLKTLPANRFVLRKYTRAKVQSNYHAFLGEDRHFYSVPNKYVGSKVEISYTTKIVEIYCQGIRIAIHDRMKEAASGSFSTIKEHQPANHQIYEQLQAYSDADYLAKADEIGENTYWAIGHILAFQPQVSQTYDSCLGIMRLAKSYGKDRLENACKRCKKMEQVNFTMLKNILKKKLDMADQNIVKSSPKIEHENIRGNYN